MIPWRISTTSKSVTFRKYGSWFYLMLLGHNYVDLCTTRWFVNVMRWAVVRQNINILDVFRQSAEWFAQQVHILHRCPPTTPTLNSNHSSITTSVIRRPSRTTKKTSEWPAEWNALLTLILSHDLSYWRGLGICMSYISGMKLQLFRSRYPSNHLSIQSCENIRPSLLIIYWFSTFWVGSQVRQPPK